MTHNSGRTVAPVAGPVRLAYRATQVLHAAGEAKERRKIAAGARRIRRKSILAALDDKFSFKVL
jgi:hypothetical protein